MPLPYPYEFDGTGTAATNLIISEPHVLTAPVDPEHANFFALDASPFFGQSLILRTGPGLGDPVLVEGTDYHLTHYFGELSEYLNKPIYGTITMVNQAYTGTVYATYQTPGGPFTLADYSTVESLTRSLYNIRTVQWAQIAGVPEFFPPLTHGHDVADLTGMAEVVAKLDELVDAVVAQGGNIASLMATLMAHISSNAAHTKADVGLGNVMNFGVATAQDVIDLVSNKYITPEMLGYAIDEFLGTVENYIPTPANSGLVLTSTGNTPGDWAWTTLTSEPRFDVSICPAFGTYLTFKAHNGGWIWVAGKNRQWNGATYDFATMAAGVLHSVFLWWNGTNLVPLVAPIGDTTFLPRRNYAAGGIVMAYNKVTATYDDTKIFLGHVYRNIGLNAWDPSTYRNMGLWYVRSYHHDCGTMVSGFHEPPTTEFYESRPYAREGRICNTAKLMGYSHLGATVDSDYSEWGIGAMDLAVPSTTLDGNVVTGGTFATVGHPDLVLGYIVWPYEELRIKGQFNMGITEGYAPFALRAHAPFALSNGAYQDRATIVDLGFAGVAVTTGAATVYYTSALEAVHYTDCVYWEKTGASYPGPELGGFRVYDMVWDDSISLYGSTGQAGGAHEAGASRLIVEPVSLNRNISDVIAYPGNIAPGMGDTPYY